MYAIPCTECNVTFVRPTYPAVSEAIREHLTKVHNLIIVDIPDS